MEIHLCKTKPNICNSDLKIVLKVLKDISKTHASASQNEQSNSKSAIKTLKKVSQIP